MKAVFTKKNVLHWTKRIFIYLAGMMICAIGVNAAIKSDLGVSSNNSLPLVLSMRFPSLSLGNWVSIIYALLVLLQIILLGKNFKWRDLLQFAVSLLFGVFVDVATLLVDICLPSVNHYLIRLCYMAIGLVGIALGLCLYMDAKIIMMPVEGFTCALAFRVNRTFTTCKIMWDIFMTALSISLSLIWFHRLEGVREGTIIIAFGVGLVMKVISKWIDAPITRFIFGEENGQVCEGGDETACRCGFKRERKDDCAK